MYQDLIPYGWDASFQEAFIPYENEGYQPGRVIAEHRQFFIVQTPTGEQTAVISGGLRYKARSRADYPAVGDWVALKANQSLKIDAVLPRKSKISRKGSGEHTLEQIIGCNVDTLLILSSLNQDFNLRRLERYLVLAKNSGAEPVMVMNKSDLCNKPELILKQLETIAPEIPVLVISALESLGLEQVYPYLKPGKTLALIGSSGVGKSTLLNALAEYGLQKVQHIRQQDARGRHTTVHRQIFLLPNQKGLILDSPGLREIQLWEGGEGLDLAFSDIQTLITHCRFKDCRHHKEPNCAVREALNTGLLDKKRWRNYLKLSDEALYLQQRKAQRREIELKIKAKNKYKKARNEALQAYISKR